MHITSPCIKLCVLDARFDLCLGCGRTSGEIASWATLSEPARVALLPALPQRLAAIGTRQGQRAALADRHRAMQ